MSESRNDEFQQRLFAVKQQREKAALEKEAALTDDEKIAMAKKRKEEEDHAKKNPYRRPSLIEGQLGLFAHMASTQKKTRSKSVHRGRGRGKAAASEPRKSTVFGSIDDATIAANQTNQTEEGSSEASATADRTSAPINREDIEKEALAAANEDADSDKLEAIKKDEHDFENAKEGEYILLKAPVLQLRMRNTKQLSLGFRKYAWKEVILVLRDSSLELFKTEDESGTRHIKIEIDDINVMCMVKELLNGFKVATKNDKSGLELRAASLEEAEGWIKAIAHNQELYRVEKKMSAITIADKDDAGAVAEKEL